MPARDADCKPYFDATVHDSFAARRKSKTRRQAKNCTWPSGPVHPQQDLIIVSLLAHDCAAWLTPREWRRFHTDPDYFELRAMQFRKELIARGEVR
jgi:hypothetical protein